MLHCDCTLCSGMLFCIAVKRVATDGRDAADLSHIGTASRKMTRKSKRNLRPKSSKETHWDDTDRDPQVLESSPEDLTYAEEDGTTRAPNECHQEDVTSAVDSGKHEDYMINCHEPPRDESRLTQQRKTPTSQSQEPKHDCPSYSGRIDVSYSSSSRQNSSTRVSVGYGETKRR